MTFEQLSDEDLVVEVLKDQDVYIHLMNRYEAKLLRYIRRLSSVPVEDAEDVLQDVFIKVYQNLNDFDRGLKFSSWIYRITHNQLMSFLRKRKARPEGWYSDAESDTVDTIASELDIQLEVDNTIARDKIMGVIGKMDIKYRDVLVLKFLEGKEYREISDILKKPMGTVATLLNRAKKQFKVEAKKQDITF